MIVVHPSGQVSKATILIQKNEFQQYILLLIRISLHIRYQLYNCIGSKLTLQRHSLATFSNTTPLPPISARRRLGDILVLEEGEINASVDTTNSVDKIAAIFILNVMYYMFGERY